MRLPPAASLIRYESSYQQGTLARTFDGRACGTGPDAKPVVFDCLGALLWAYRHMDAEDRHDVSKRVFDACNARYGHTHLGKLVWEDALDLLTSCGA
jgi:hypothetical protein